MDHLSRYESIVIIVVTEHEFEVISWTVKYFPNKIVDESCNLTNFICRAMTVYITMTAWRIRVPWTILTKGRLINITGVSCSASISRLHILAMILMDPMNTFQTSLPISVMILLHLKVTPSFDSDYHRNYHIGQIMTTVVLSHMQKWIKCTKGLVLD